MGKKRAGVDLRRPRTAFALLAGGLLGIAPAAAWQIVFPFPPFGQADRELLREADEEAVEPLLLEGRLLDEDGAAIAGAELVLVPVGDPRTCIWRDNRVQPIARSDRQGRFRFESLDPRDWAQLSVSASGFVPQDFDLGQLRTRVFPAEYRLGRSGGVRLRAVDPEGRPVAGAGIFWRSQAIDSTDEEGAFEAGKLPPGRQLLVVKAHSLRWLVPAEIAAGGGDLALALLPEYHLPLAGKLLDARGRPLSGSLVLVSAGELLDAAGTEPDGSFSFGSYPDGEYALRVTDGVQVFDLPSFRLSDLEAPLEVRLPSGSALRGRVEGLEKKDSGRLFVTAWRPQPEPVPGYRFGPFAPGGIERVDARLAGGAFVIEGLGEGEWSLRAGVLGRTGLVEEQVTLRAGEDLADLVLALPPEE